MDRIERIRTNDLFMDCVSKTAECERNRIFCRHDWEHFINTARIACILSLEEKLDIEREYVYAAALLHDIGRHRQYLEGVPHEEAGADIAAVILYECGFLDDEIGLITDAVRSHRDIDASGKAGKLAAVLYRADKLSRECWSCAAREECRWPDEKKNLTFRL